MKHLIPKPLQDFINNILETKLDLGEIKIHPHPFASHNDITGDKFDRYIHIHKMIIDLKIPRTYIEYRQVLRNKISGAEEPSNLPTPEFIIWETDMSTLRFMFVPEPLRQGIEIDEIGRLMLPFVETDDEGNDAKNEDGSIKYVFEEDGITIKKAPYEMSSHTFLIWLQKNNLIGLYALIESYFVERINSDKNFKDKLDKLA